MKSLGIAAAACAAVALAGVGPAQAATPEQIISALNQQRAQNGIPANIRENGTWSADCAAHDRWMAENRTVAHAEPPGSRGYSQGGNWVAPNAVLAGGEPFDFTTPATDPYLNAPYHLAAILNPRLSVMGAAEVDNADCETTYPGYRRPRPRKDRVYTFPGNHATASWFEIAQELPNTPGDAVGLPEGTATGPDIIMFGEGARRRTTLWRVKASLHDASGHAVATRTVNAADQTEGGLGFMIPVQPLRPSSTYHARVTFGRTGRTRRHRSVTKRWSFTTTKLATGSSGVKLDVSHEGSSAVVQTEALDPAYQGRTATLRATYRYIGGSTTDTTEVTIGESGVSFTWPSPGESVDFVLAVHGFSIGSTNVPPFELSQSVDG